ncbi:hypothetical protein EMIT0P4_110113 [Pseudomonas sp. IT-P4]
MTGIRSRRAVGTAGPNTDLLTIVKPSPASPVQSREQGHEGRNYTLKLKHVSSFNGG